MRLSRLIAPILTAATLAGCAAATPPAALLLSTPAVSRAATGAEAGLGAALDRAAAAAGSPAPVRMRWDGAHAQDDAWTQATLAAVDRAGPALTGTVPRDIHAFCPAYAAQSPEGRGAFWAGLLSAVAKHESTYNPGAKGGGGQWLGLMQIAPATWRHYGCSGDIFRGADNLACAVRIVARQVGRDGAVAGGPGAWRGVARDWAPMRKAGKRADIAGWTRAQPYCRG